MLHQPPNAKIHILQAVRIICVNSSLYSQLYELLGVFSSSILECKEVLTCAEFQLKCVRASKESHVC